MPSLKLENLTNDCVTPQRIEAPYHQPIRSAGFPPESGPSCPAQKHCDQSTSSQPTDPVSIRNLTSEYQIVWFKPGCIREQSSAIICQDIALCRQMQVGRRHTEVKDLCHGKRKEGRTIGEPKRSDFQYTPCKPTYQCEVDC